MSAHDKRAMFWRMLLLAAGLLLAAALLAFPAAASDSGPLNTPTPSLPPGTGGLVGRAWNDLDADGAYGPGEPPLAGLTVAMQGPLAASTVSDADGAYRLIGLPPGIYQVTAAPPAGYQMSTPATYSVLVAAGALITLDFGAYLPPTPTPTATPQPLLDASNAETAYCGGVYRGDTHAGKNNVSRYSCRPGWDESGPELVYRIEVNAAQPVSVALLSATADLDLFLMRYVFPDSCVAAGDTFLTYQADPGVYLLSVDGYEGAAGAYTFRVDCPLGQQATATPTFTPTQRPTATLTPTPGPTFTPSITPRPYLLYLPLVLRNYPLPPLELTTITLQAGVGGYMAATDTTLDSWEPATPQGDDRDLRLFFSRTQAYSTSKSPVLRFGMDFLPAGAIVERAELELYVPVAPAHDLRGEVRGLLRPWSEASATWNEAATGQPWAQPGARGLGSDHSAWVSADQRIAAGGRWYAFDVTALAATWVRSPAQNYGMILFAQAGADAANVEVQFASREYPDPALRPRLVITYGVP
ncbi:MAG: hypothetical protein BWY52_03182 [Chloroflexi bacterium ADurb.Bin325]|nr:MAG: hypothetical protein BWY52_03182 [Chloroflexi bacterium ADurb.Bin325]